MSDLVVPAPVRGGVLSHRCVQARTKWRQQRAGVSQLQGGDLTLQGGDLILPARARLSTAVRPRKYGCSSNTQGCEGQPAFVFSVGRLRRRHPTPYHRSRDVSLSLAHVGHWDVFEAWLQGEFKD